MTALEIQNIKLELVQSIINIDNEDSLKRLSLFIKQLNDKYPCMYSVEEMQSSVEEAITAYKEGDKSKFISHEEVRKRHAI